MVSRCTPRYGRAVRGPRLLTCSIVAELALVAGCGEERATDAPATSARCLSQSSVSADAFFSIYDPSVDEDSAWYINDHTIIQGEDGIWHLFGITHAEPADPGDEKTFAHAIATSLTQRDWQKMPPALTADAAYGETFLWAPYVIRWDGMYWMFYCGGAEDPTNFQIRLATSTDLYTWVRHPEPLFTDGYDGRDPMVLSVDGTWVLYYTATSDPHGGAHVVAYRTSDDLVHWGERQIAFVDPSSGTGGGPTESPFVVAREGSYYLFTGPRPGYVGTDVFRSDDPFSFDIDDQVGHIASHAAEIVRDVDGDMYVTSAGWGQQGVYLSAVRWCEPARPDAGLAGE